MARKTIHEEDLQSVRDRVAERSDRECRRELEIHLTTTTTATKDQEALEEMDGEDHPLQDVGELLLVAIIETRPCLQAPITGEVETAGMTGTAE
jgi:hypothetical protein